MLPPLLSLLPVPPGFVLQPSALGQPSATLVHADLGSAAVVEAVLSSFGVSSLASPQRRGSAVRVVLPPVPLRSVSLGRRS